MIAANELRIGNWVKRGKHFLKVTSISDYVKSKQLSAFSNNMDCYELPFEDYEPIPLTPEILQSCGFKFGMVKGITRITDSADDPEEEGDTYYWDLKVPKNDHVEDLSTFSLLQFGKGNDIKFSHQWLRVKVKYLHQLQNLYFALTSTDLEISHK